MKIFNEDKTQILINITNEGITAFPLDLSTAIYIPVEQFELVVAGTHMFKNGLFCKKDLVDNYYKKLETEQGTFYLLPIKETRNDIEGSRLYIVVHTDGNTYYLRYVDNVFTEVYLINNPEPNKFISYRVGNLLERSDYTINTDGTIYRYEGGKMNRTYILEEGNITCEDGRIYSRTNITEEININRLYEDLMGFLNSLNQFIKYERATRLGETFDKSIEMLDNEAREKAIRIKELRKLVEGKTVI